MDFYRKDGVAKLFLSNKLFLSVQSLQLYLHKENTLYIKLVKNLALYLIIYFSFIILYNIIK